MSEDQEVQFSPGSQNTYLAIALVASTLALALSVFSLQRISTLTDQVAVGLVTLHNNAK